MPAPMPAPMPAWPAAAAAGPRRVAAADVQSIIRRAQELEAGGRDLLGHDTVLDIARELNVDSMFVREALRRHQASLEMPPLSGLTAMPRPITPRASRGRATGLLVGGIVVGLAALGFVLSATRISSERVSSATAERLMREALRRAERETRGHAIPAPVPAPKSRQVERP
jgi:hypothetical protein